MYSTNSNLLNQRYVLIAMLMLLFGVTFSVHAQYSPVGSIDVTDRLDIEDKAMITKRLATAAPWIDSVV